MLQSFYEELRKLATDKLMWVVCIIMPICVNLLVGWEFSCGVIDRVPVAIVDNDHSQLSRQIIGYFKNNDAFSVDYEVATQDELQELLDTSKVRVGMVIPEDFSYDVTELKSPSILMLYDGSHMSMISIAKAKASEILLTARVGASLKQIEVRHTKTDDEAMTMAMPISFVYRNLYNPTKSFNNFMTPGYGTIVCQLGIAFVAALSVCFPRDDKRFRSAAAYLAGKILFYGTLGSITIATNILVQVNVFKIRCEGNVLLGIALGVLFMFSVASLCIMISAWSQNRVLAQALCGLLLIPNSIFSGYTWPVMCMLPFYKGMSKLIPFSHFGDNLRYLYFKGKMPNLAGDIRFFILFTAAMFLLGIGGIYFNKLGKEKEPDMR